MIRFATIGRGSIVDCFIEGARTSGKLCLSAVYSRNKADGEVFARKHGVNKVYTSLADLACDRDINAIYIASPNSLHAGQSEFLLKAGKHILCEKPIATSAAEYKRLKDLADSLGLIYMEAIIPIYSPFRPAIKKALGEIGKISVVRLDYCQRSSRYDDYLAGKDMNIFNMSLAGGALMDIGVYCVYAAVDLFGVPKDISASASFLRGGTDGSGAAIFSYDGHVACLTYGKTSDSTLGCEIEGDGGSVTIGKVGLYANASIIKDGKALPLTKFTEKAELMGLEASRFADYINGVALDEYSDNSRLCFDVHTCMDKIKQCANIKYPTVKE